MKQNPVRQTKADPAVGDAPADSAEQQRAEAEAAARFLADLVARGEAVEVNGHGAGAAGRAQGGRDEDDPLPPGATHEVVRGERGEQPTVRRRRYSAF